MAVEPIIAAIEASSWTESSFQFSKTDHVMWLSSAVTGTFPLRKPPNQHRVHSFSDGGVQIQVTLRFICLGASLKSSEQLNCACDESNCSPFDPVTAFIKIILKCLTFSPGIKTNVSD